MIGTFIGAPIGGVIYIASVIPVPPIDPDITASQVIFQPGLALALGDPTTGDHPNRLQITRSGVSLSKTQQVFR